MLKNRQPSLSWYANLYDLIPETHILRKVNALVEFSFVNELVADTYCRF